MKRAIAVIFGTLLLLGCLSGCGKEGGLSGKETDADGERLKKEFGSYVIASSWKESEKLSGDDRFVYIPKDAEEIDETNVFIVSAGENHYAQSQHSKFKESVLEHLSYRLGADTRIYTEERTTAQGYTVYCFSFSLPQTGETLLIYYIVGEKRHCSILLGGYDNSKECIEAVNAMVDSFIWNE